MKLQLLSAMLLASVVSTSQATVVYDESVSGDLSNTQATPTGILLALGTNSVLGNVNSGAADARDFLTITVPVGFQLSQYVHVAWSGIPADQGFTGFQNGNAIVGSLGTSSTYNGWSHFGQNANNTAFVPHTPFNSIGQDLLPIMQSESTGANQAQGFTIPLAAGNYAFVIQDTSGSGNYQFDFNVTAVPEPSSIALLGFAGVAGIARWRRRRVA